MPDGHRHGVLAFRRTLDCCQRWSLPQLTVSSCFTHAYCLRQLCTAPCPRYKPQVGIVLQVYAFSKENWQRPRAEVDFVLKLLESTLENELGMMMAQGVRCGFIGDREGLPDSLLRWMDRQDSCLLWVQPS